AGGVHRVGDLLDEAAGEPERPPDARLDAEHLLRELGRAGDERAAAGEDHARREVPPVARALDLDPYDLHDLLEPRLDDLRERALPDGLVRPPADAGDRDLLVLGDEVHERDPELPLEPLGLLVEDAEA